MFDVSSYMNDLTSLLLARFGARLTYVGLQGSYLRGEATEASDIDPMVVIDGLTPGDLDAYRSIVEQLPSPELSCGFICGRQELACWNPLEICHLLHTTKDWYGTLSALVPACTDADVRSFVRLSTGNMLHELCHRYIHSNRDYSAARLPATCKGVFFILQDAVYLEQGMFAATKRDLVPLLQGDDRLVFDLSQQLMAGSAYDFDAAFALLLRWCQNMIIRMK